VKKTLKRVAMLPWLLVALAAVLLPAAVMAIVPLAEPPPALVPIDINIGAGDQFNPGVSGDWVAYTSEISIRYFNFSTNTDAEIPLGNSAHDLLSDISGSKIVFSRVIPAVKTAVMVFDAATPAVPPVEIDPALGTTRYGSAIGGDTVAYIDFGLHPNGELVIHDLATSLSVRITDDTASDGNPLVSPGGDVVVWEHCLTSTVNCDIWQAVKTGAVWSVSIVSDSANPEANPDTNGTLVVYDSLRAGNSDIFWRPMSGGAEVQLQLPGYEANPGIAGNLISFESRPNLLSTSDIFVYDTATNRLFQITDTPLVNEQLNAITVLPDGSFHVVWCSDEDGFDQRNVKGATFKLPPVVKSASDQITDLIALLQSLHLRPFVAFALEAELWIARALAPSHPGAACWWMNAFIRDVQAQTGKAIAAAQATQLLAAASQIKSALGCP
jgi:hypothetical protein